ncbi:hypothetical protein COW36_03040 [bacterium (Candidatus Blackallbacteria) CG17_big_fil_post_rev_8_21_14_2_50_48_46]|uniref:Uncharacterized protein n=1 Tax=bacterium (Candidatus Blackallbacteria) CG17_big_fil_post_rev_8_21_14_2_50_48_46 TaxID=2014261 RepID=A0A2M7GAC8_9BACT|nr:MAG: hypothetical protein COW64_12435 [bacterium (Candidatus Blackallbacteria) CG18_big_fil_WC_8_21_14_2_50_49_26]PIW19102.1 MAG: hypothetical protein COW36_03040 [bacterium (Candidatus Blackallbacteria) CG17_big_fil_post_rev_8_21_14_2_50_48_46]PIW44531.1 MAG: hypothetical protein COW20_23080 [bacterium (Candidatus Blackallbacteria) CG13_big_fil_rev_8_21_14_2_50_49_14]
MTALKASACIWLFAFPLQIVVKSVLHLPSFLGLFILCLIMSIVFDYFYVKESKKKALFLLLSFLFNLLIIFLGMGFSAILLPRFL